MTHSTRDDRTAFAVSPDPLALARPSVHLLGGASIHIDGVPAGGAAAHRHRLALLTILATSGRPVSRDKLIALLWPERDTTSARNLLKVAVHALRKVLGEPALRTIGDQIALDELAVTCDVVQFEAALREGALEAAVALYTGPLLDGFYLKDAPDFEQLAESERARLAQAYSAALEQLAATADLRRELVPAVRWWRLLANCHPERADVAMHLMRALAATGDVPGALRHAEIHAKLRREMVGLGADPTVELLAKELRSAPAPQLAPAQQPSPAQAALMVAPEGKQDPPLGAPRAVRGAYGRRAVIAVASVVVLAGVAAGGVLLRAGTGKTERPSAAPPSVAPDTGGGALVFDGEHGIAATPVATTITHKTDDIAFDMMVRYDGYIPGTTYGLLFYNGNAGVSGWGVLVLPPKDGIREGTLAVLAGGVAVLPTALTLKRGVWHHLTVQRRATRVTLTLDDLSFDAGVLMANPLGASQAAIERTILGGTPHENASPDQFFHGALARVRVRDLSNNYWIERWNFGEGSGTTTTGDRGSTLSLVNVGWSGSRR